MSFSDRTMTEPYTSREVSTVPGEGDANLLLQDSKAAAPYSTRKRRCVPVMIWKLFRVTLQLMVVKPRRFWMICRAAMSVCSLLRCCSSMLRKPNRSWIVQCFRRLVCGLSAERKCRTCCVSVTFISVFDGTSFSGDRTKLSAGVFYQVVYIGHTRDDSETVGRASTEEFPWPSIWCR